MAYQFMENPGSRMRGRRANAEQWNTVSRTFETSSNAQLPFGVPAVAGSGRMGCVALTAAGQNVLGITEAHQVLPRPGDYYLQFDTVPICEFGVMNVEVGDAVVKGAQARFNVTSGKWTDSAASATVLTIPGAFFDESGGADGEILPIRYRRPQPSVSAA
jgi:hypothetical protein